MDSPFPQLETKRLILRRITPDDAEAVFDVLSDEEVTKYYDVETFANVGEARQWLARMEDRQARGEALRWAMVSKADERLVGTCGYAAMARWTARGSVGYELSRAEWGKGLMPEALEAIIRYGFEQRGLRRIEAYVVPGNYQSARVLEKLGFKLEGTLRAYGYWKGKHWDLESYSLLNSEKPVKIQVRQE